jgi:hypothetical protein
MSRQFVLQLATLFLTASAYEDTLSTSETTFVIPQCVIKFQLLVYEKRIIWIAEYTVIK